MAKKAELEAAYIRYANICREAAEAESRRDFAVALRSAELSLTHQSLAIAYQRKFLKKDEPAAGAVDCILRLAPPLFARRSLDALQAYADSRKKTERSLMPDLSDKVREARERLSQATQLWSDLFHSSTNPTNLKATNRTTSWFVEVWSGMGLVVVKGSDAAKKLVLVTDLRRACWARCSGCGVLRQAPTVEFLGLSYCPACGQRHEFVIAQRCM